MATARLDPRSGPSSRQSLLALATLAVLLVVSLAPPQAALARAERRQPVVAGGLRFDVPYDARVQYDEHVTSVMATKGLAILVMKDAEPVDPGELLAETYVQAMFAAPFKASTRSLPAARCLMGRLVEGARTETSLLVDLSHPGVRMRQDDFVLEVPGGATRLQLLILLDAQGRPLPAVREELQRVLASLRVEAAPSL